MLNLGPSFFHKYLSLSKDFETVLLFVRVLQLVRISAILAHIGRVRAQKPPKNIYFVDAELEIFNLRTTNGILMKLTTIMYLHESVDRKALRIRNSFFFLLNLIASLVRLLYKLDNIRGSIPRKTTQNRFKMIATLTSLKLRPKEGVA